MDMHAFEAFFCELLSRRHSTRASVSPRQLSPSFSQAYAPPHSLAYQRAAVPQQQVHSYSDTGRIDDMM